MIKKKNSYIKYSLFLFFLMGFLATYLLRAEGKKLTLESAVCSALANNERAAVAGEKVIASRARLLKARAVFLPALDATGTYTRRPFEVVRNLEDQTIVIQSLNALAASITLNMTVFDPASLPLVKQLKLESRAEEYNSLESRRELAFEVCNAFLLTLSIEQMLNAARQRHELAKINLEASKARFEAQLISVNDVTRTELEVATAEKDLIRTTGDVENARLALEFLFGSQIEGELELPDRLLAEAESPAPIANELITRALNFRPDLHALQWTARAQHAGAREPNLRWLPNLDLNGQYRFTNETGLSGRSSNWSVGLTLNWSLFDGFSRTADFREKKALAHIADLDLQEARRRIDVEVRNALITLKNQQASTKQAAVALEVARKNAAETTELFRQGLTGALEAADANVSLYEAEVGFIRERFGLAIAFLNLRLALGIGPFGQNSENGKKNIKDRTAKEF